MRSSLTLEQRRNNPSELAMWTLGLFGSAVLWILMLKGQFNLLCTVIILGSLLLVSLHDRATAILLTLSYLVLMGDIRRILAALVGPPEQDLLLLIGPAIAVVLAFPIFLSLRLRDGLSKAMFFLLLVMVLEIFNPKQGGLTIGLSGAVFYIAPVLWFWIGRRFGSPEVVEKLLYRVIFPLALLAALLGFVQTFVGFLPYEQAWIDVASKTYTALHLGASIRAFGFSVSGAEYAALLMIGAVGVAAAYLGSGSRWAVISPILLAGIIFASARGTVIKVVVTLALVWTLRKGQKLRPKDALRLVVFALGGLVAVVLLASHFTGSEVAAPAKNSAVDNALAHQVGGLAHPFDPRYSTAGLHGGMFLSGVVEGFTYPIGHGLGSTTAASSKFGGDPNEGNSEIDISDMFISLGVIGGLLYLYIVAMAMRGALRYLRTVRRGISLPVLAILTSSLGSWLIGGQYSTSALMLFLIGAISYTDMSQSEDTESMHIRMRYQERF
jgi:hypothetical protein